MTTSDKNNSSSNEPLSLTRTSSSSIRQELQQIRGDLFDISDADSSIALILAKVQQLTEFENRVVEDQRNEIGLLREELERLRQKEREGQNQIDLQLVPSFGSISMNSSSSPSIGGALSPDGSPGSSGCDNESERHRSYSIFSNQQFAQKASLSQSIAVATDQLRELDATKSKTEEEITSMTERLRELTKSEDRIRNEIDKLKEQVQLLLKERTKLIQEVEVYTHETELVYELETAKETNAELETQLTELRNRADRAIEDKERAERAAHRERETAQQWNANFQREVERAKRAADEARDEKETTVAELRHRLEKEILVRREMQKNMEQIYKEKIACEKELDDLKKYGVGDKNASAVIGGAVGVTGADIARLKREIETLRGENASLRSTAERDAEVIASLNDELRSLISVGDVPAALSPAKVDVAKNAGNVLTPASRKRALVLSQGSIVGSPYKRSIRYEPNRNGLEKIDSAILGRERLGSNDGSQSLEQQSRSIGGASLEEQQTNGGSDTAGDTVSALNDTDNVSLLFGQESVGGKSVKSADGKETVASDHDGIRAHAEKLLYWANKASERSAKKGGDASVASPQQMGTISSSNSNKFATPIPKTIGLPPRSQSRVRKASPLPPRCPPPSALSSSVDGNGTVLSDKENGGCSFNRAGDILGAFPTSNTSSKTKKNVSLSHADTIIQTLDFMNDDPVICCECSISPFSGNDARSEFYLPKLGLACTCGANTALEDRTSFSKNPTSLSNILRPWQCAFLTTLDVNTANELLKAHKADANGMARKMKKWRNQNGMAATRSKECYVALKVWSRTCKVVLRSIREQKEQARRRAEEDVVIEKPHFLDITFADTHTIASISTLGQFSSVGGGRPFEMMEI